METRLATALAASVIAHVSAALLVAAAGTPGSLTGGSKLSAQPLQARITGPAARAPTLAEPPLLEPPRAEALSSEPDTDRAARVPEVPSTGKPTSGPSPAPAEEQPQPFGLREGVTYYLASELDERPRALSAVDPAYPRMAPPGGGYVVAQLLVSETGAVERVNIAVADPPGYFEQAVTDAFSAARFSPGKRNGVSVKSQVWIELKFHALAPDGLGAPSADDMPR